MKDKKITTWILFALLVGVWGTIAFKIYASSHTSGLDDGSVLADNSLSLHPRSISPRFVYTSDVREPFAFRRPGVRDTSKRQSSQKIAWSPPPLRLTGLVTTGKRRTAMIESPEGAVHFLHEGDTVAGVKLLKIDRESVRYLYKKRKGEWTLEQHP